MSLSDELDRLAQLHSSGALSDTEFERAKARVLEGAPSPAQGPALAALNRLHRSRSDRWIGGVCGGLAVYTGIASWIWRLFFVLSLFCAGTGVLIYLLMWMLVPEAAEEPVARTHGEPA